MKSNIFGIGGINTDHKYHISSKINLYTSNIATSSYSYGGVIRNVLENLGRLGENVTLLSVVGNDLRGEDIINYSKEFMKVDKILRTDKPTGSYVAITEPEGDMFLGLAVMDNMIDLNINYLKKYEEDLKRADYIVIDSNLDMETINYLIALAKKYYIKLIIVGVSGPKTANLPLNLKGVYLAIHNLDESQSYFNSSLDDIKLLTSFWVDRGVEISVVTNGVHNVCYQAKGEKVIEVPVKKSKHFVDATGAGDSFSSGVIYGLANNNTLRNSITLGLVNSYYTVASTDSVRKNLTSETLLKEMEKYKNDI